VRNLSLTVPFAGSTCTYRLGFDLPVGVVGLWPSLAIDAQGRPHLAYYNDNDADLMYAVRDGSTWQLTTVDSAGHVGAYSSLALDSAGRPHISYYDWDAADLKYARWDGTAWRIEVVVSQGEVGRYTSLALDSVDRPHIAYYDATGEDLEYVYWTGTRWQQQTVNSTGHVGIYPSLALDGADRPHVSYWDGTNGRIKYAYRSAGGWIIRIVGNSGGPNSSLALDAQGRPHVIYHDVYWTDLKYASWTGSAWDTHIAASGVDPASASLALDRPTGQAHIVYTRNGDTMHAQQNGASWQAARAAEGGDTIFRGYTAVAVDASGRPHLAFLEEGEGDLRYARREGDTWTVETVQAVCGDLFFYDGRSTYIEGWFSSPSTLSGSYDAYECDGTVRPTSGTWTASWNGAGQSHAMPGDDTSVPRHPRLDSDWREVWPKGAR
jgi:hypothetical protein